MDLVSISQNNSPSHVRPNPLILWGGVWGFLFLGFLPFASAGVRGPSPEGSQRRHPVQRFSIGSVTGLPSLPDSCSLLARHGSADDSSALWQVHRLRYQLCQDIFSSWGPAAREFLFDGAFGFTPGAPVPMEELRIRLQSSDNLLRQMRRDYLRLRDAHEQWRQLRDHPPSIPLSQRRSFRIPQVRDAAVEPEWNESVRLVRHRAMEREVLRVLCPEGAQFVRCEAVVAVEAERARMVDRFLETGEMEYCWNPTSIVVSNPSERAILCATTAEILELSKQDLFSPSLEAVAGAVRRGIPFSVSVMDRETGLQRSYTALGLSGLVRQRFSQFVSPGDAERIGVAGFEFCSPYLAPSRRHGVEVLLSPQRRQTQTHRSDINRSQVLPLFELHRDVVGGRLRGCSPQLVLEAFGQRARSLSFAYDVMAQAFPPENTEASEARRSFCRLVASSSIGRERLRAWVGSPEGLERQELAESIQSALNGSSLGPLTSPQVRRYGLSGSGCFEGWAGLRSQMESVNAQLRECLGVHGGALSMDPLTGEVSISELYSQSFTTIFEHSDIVWQYETPEFGSYLKLLLPTGITVFSGEGGQPSLDFDGESTGTARQALMARVFRAEGQHFLSALRQVCRGGVVPRSSSRGQ